MGKTIVILAPHQTCNEEVDRRYGRAPGNLLLRFFQPFSVLVEHGIDDVDEGFITGEKAMAAGENVSLKPAFERVLTEYLHNAAEEIKLAAISVVGYVLGKPCFLRGSIDSSQPVGGGLVRSEDAERTHISAHHLGKKVCEHIGRQSVSYARPFHFDGIVAKVRQFELFSQPPA